jgi:hypothetical protein
VFLLVEPDDAAVDLYPHDTAGRSRKRDRQGRQPDPDLDDDIIGADLTWPDDGLGGMAVDEEILAELLFRGEMVFLQGGSGLAVN